MALDKDSFAGSGIAAEGPRTRGEGRPAGPVDSFELHGVEQVFLDDLLPDDALSKAMEACDEAAIWAQYGEAPDKSRFLRSLGSLAGYYSTHQPHRRGASTLWHNALMAVAFLLPPERRPAVQPAGTDQKAASAVYMQLQQWLGYGPNGQGDRGFGEISRPVQLVTPAAARVPAGIDLAQEQLQPAGCAGISGVPRRLAAARVHARKRAALEPRPAAGELVGRRRH